MGEFKNILLLVLFTLSCSPVESLLGATSETNTVGHVSNLTTNVIAKSRNATVQIFSYDDMGRQISGSGAYVVYKKKHFILTATHVIKYSNKALVISGREEILAEVVYAHEPSDIAVLRVEGMATRVPLTWKTSLPRIGEKILYTGFPNSYEYLTIDGIVSGQTLSRIVLHSFAWGGSSGSVVLDGKARIVGIVSAIDIGMGYFGEPHLNQDVVLISPTHGLDIEGILDSMQ